MQYAKTFGYTVWLRPQDPYLGKGVAASGPLATRLGLSGVPVAAETIALHTLFALMRSTGARVHLCRISSAAGVELVRQGAARAGCSTRDIVSGAGHDAVDEVSGLHGWSDVGHQNRSASPAFSYGCA